MDLIKTYEDNINDNVNSYDDDLNFRYEESTYSFINSSSSCYSTHTIDTDTRITMETIETFKIALAQTIKGLENAVDFLKNELEEKNLLIRALIFSQANDGRKIDPELLNSSTVYSIETSCSENIEEEETWEELYNHWMEFEESENLQRIRQERQNEYINMPTDHRPHHKQHDIYCEELYEDILSNSSGSFSDSPDFAAWEKHSNAFGSKILNKFGYNGRGLGKHENGIVSPIIAGSNTKHFSLTAKHPSIYRKQNRVGNNIHYWPKGTTLITGSSIIMGLEEKRLQKYQAKVRPFPGACVDDMFDYLLPLLKKRPTNIVLHIGSNDAAFKSANDIANEIRSLKAFIEKLVPGVKLFLSCPIIRLDNNKANNTLLKLATLFKHMESNIITNDNIDASCLGKKGLHLNPKGSGRLAINFISLMRRL